MKFTWLLFFQILRAILEIIMQLPDDVDPRQAAREMRDALNDVDPNHSGSPTPKA